MTAGPPPFPRRPEQKGLLELKDDEQFRPGYLLSPDEHQQRFTGHLMRCDR
ncbi:hypothetical protein ABT319_35875 [Streptomyces sp. NPDC000678]|uniref:hypothetical protein n=1 Tax=Streptomyces sp. NPDC000678 TaxID=3154268 RepID=UPI003317FAEA